MSQGLENFFAAKGQMDIYNVMCNPYEIVDLKNELVDLLNFESHLQLPW